jgi:hypothetical protein
MSYTVKYREQEKKAEREKPQVTYKGRPVRIRADFSTETLKAMRGWNDEFQALKENNCQSRLVSQQSYYTIEGEAKTFHNKQKLKQFMTTKSTL